MSAVRKAAPRKRSGTVAPVLSEARFQSQVVKLAKLKGWVAWHCVMPKRSAAGLPDLILVGPDAERGVVWAELKSARGVLRPEQVAFIAALRAAGQTVYVWKPADWTEIEKVLA